MKKSHLIAWSAALVFALSPLTFGTAANGPQTVLSDPQSPKGRAERFVHEWCGIQSFDQDGQTVTFTWFAKADPVNAPILSQGFALYQSLEESVKNEVDALCAANGVDFASLGAQAAALLEKENNEPANAPAKDAPVQPEKPAETEADGTSPNPSAGKDTESGVDESAAAISQDADSQKTQPAPSDSQDEDTRLPEGGTRPANPAQGSNAGGENESNPQPAPENPEQPGQPETGENQPAPEGTDQPALQAPSSIVLESNGSGAVISVSYQKAQIPAELQEAISQLAENRSMSSVSYCTNIVYSAVLGENRAVSPAMQAIASEEGSVLFSVITGADGTPEALQIYQPAVYSFNFDSGIFTLQPAQTFPLTKKADEKDPEEQPPVQNPDNVIADGSAVQNPSSESKPSLGPQVPAEDKPAMEADEFVSRYCTHNGSVIKVPSSSNYQKILDGFSVWSSMNTAARERVNALLEEQGSVSYQSLYTGANQIRLGLPVSTQDQPEKNPPVQTSLFTDQAAYGAAAASAGAALWLGWRKKKENR